MNPVIFIKKEGALCRASAYAAGALALRERNHNFRHFSSFGGDTTFL